MAPNMYSLDDPDGAKLIYGTSSKMPKSDWFAGWGEPGIVNHNVFSAEDIRIHAQMRRRLTPIYSMTAIKSYEPYVDSCISSLLEQLDRFASSSSVIDLQKWMQSYAFDVIGEITFSTRLGFLKTGRDIDRIIKGIDSLNVFSTLFGYKRILLPLLLLRFGNPARGMLHWVAKLKQARRNEGGVDTNRRAEDFCTKVEVMRKKDPEGIVRDRAENAMSRNVAARSDSISLSLTAIMFYLAKNPEIMNKLRRELKMATQ